jgi:protein tyrosine phosphatase (PTP) superfamily phosphohydrolase (DUF442 family)
MKKILTIFISNFILVFCAHAHDNMTASKHFVNGKNFVKVSDRIDTSGQPSLASLKSIGEKEYDLIINLAPPLSQGSILEEGGLVAKTGASYVNIPVDWNKPTINDFEFFSQVLGASKHQKVLVHCQINMRGSIFTFLYRVVVEKIDADSAYEKMTEVWKPSEQWLSFAQMVLQKHNVNFTFY